MKFEKMNDEMEAQPNPRNMELMDHLQNAVVLDASYRSKNKELYQEWTPTLEDQIKDITKVKSFNTRSNIVKTFEVPTTDQLRYGGDLSLKIGNKIEGFLELLQKGVVIGDGDCSENHEICGNSTLQELVLDNPEKLNQLYSNFLEAGSDVVRAFSFCPSMADNADINEVKLNEISCKIACKLAAEQNAFVAGAICPSDDYMKGIDKEHLQAQFKEQMEVFHNCKVDVLLCDMFAVEETEWALEVMKTSGIPIAVTLCVDKLGTVSGTSLGDCAIKMARAGADVVGVCCKFDVEAPDVITQYVEIMRAALDRVGLQIYIMACPHAGSLPNNQHHSHHYKNQNFKSNPLEQHVMKTYARALYEAGVRFFRAGSGLGTSYIQYISNELVKERARTPINIKPSGFFTMDKYQAIKKGSKQYWSGVISPSCYETTFNLPESA